VCLNPSIFNLENASEPRKMLGCMPSTLHATPNQVVGTCPAPVGAGVPACPA